MTILGSEATMTDRERLDQLLDLLGVEDRNQLDRLLTDERGWDPVGCGCCSYNPLAWDNLEPVDPEWKGMELPSMIEMMFKLSPADTPLLSMISGNEAEATDPDEARAKAFTWMKEEFT
jgi:hypothetical protein